MSRFHPRAVNVGFMGHKMAHGKAPQQEPHFSAVSFRRCILYIHLQSTPCTDAGEKGKSAHKWNGRKRAQTGVLMYPAPANRRYFVTRLHGPVSRSVTTITATALSTSNLMKWVQFALLLLPHTVQAFQISTNVYWNANCEKLGMSPGKQNSKNMP